MRATAAHAWGPGRAAAVAAALSFLASAGCERVRGPGGNPEFEERLRFEQVEKQTFSAAGEDMDAAVVAAPRGDPAGYYLYFASTHHAQQPDIFRKPLHGDVAVEQLTLDRAADRFPRPRPGEPDKIVFASNRRGNWDLWLLQLRANDPPLEIQLTADDADDLAPSWSPDGQYLAYASFRSGATSGELRVLHFASKRSTQVSREGFLPDWHPKENLIVFQRARRRPIPEEPWYGLWTLTTAGTELREVVSPPDWAAIHPTWSPDGEWIAFASVSKSADARKEKRWQKGDDIWVVRADGQRLTQLTYHPAPDYAPTWGPDNRIYFTSEREGWNGTSGRPNIWSVRPVLP